MDYTQLNENLIDALSKIRLHQNDNGSTGVQIILKMIRLNSQKYHTKRNLLDAQLGTQVKTNEKDIDAIRSSKRSVQIIRKHIRYLSRNLKGFKDFINVLNEFKIEYKKYLTLSDKINLSRL